MLIPAEVHAQFGKEFYQALKATMTFEENVIPPIPVIHASKLFPEADDKVKFRFLEAIVELARKFECKLYRVGYFTTPEALSTFQDKKNLLGMSFAGILYLLQKELSQHEIWPVMETDHTSDQDEMFAGQLQRIDYYTSMLGPASMSIDNANLGELHYSTKKSAYGSLTNCIAYLLDARYLKQLGPIDSSFKRRLAQIADDLSSMIAFDEIIEIQFTAPPADYASAGPLRFAMPVVPTD